MHAAQVMIDKVIVVRADFGRVDVGYRMLRDRKCRTEVFSQYTTLDLKSEYVQMQIRRWLHTRRKMGWIVVR